MARNNARTHILVVDDAADSADLLRVMLEVKGYGVSVAQNADEALVIMDASSIDIALIDIGLPGTDGNALARKLRASPRTARCRLIAITGYGHPDALAASKKIGFEAHFMKPVDLNDLLRVIASADNE